MQSWQDMDEAQIDPASQETMLAVANEALRLGADHFETARGYGSSSASSAEVLEQVGRDQVILQTKVQPCADPEQFSAEVRDSLARLRVARVDLLALRCQRPPGAVARLPARGLPGRGARRLQARGLVARSLFPATGPRGAPGSGLPPR